MLFDQLFVTSSLCILFVFMDTGSALFLTKPPAKLLLISLDGFRHDYLELARLAGVNISAFERIWRTGFRAMRVQNEFVTRTGPNHFSLATGLHEESHGLVDNTFYDPKMNATFHLSNLSQVNDSRWFDVGAEPIWVTNERHGHQSAVNAWPGTKARIKGRVPSHVYPHYNFSIPFQKSIDWMIEQLTKPDTTLGMLYHIEPDAQGHVYGPYSHQVLQVIGSINQDLAYLLQRVDMISSLRTNLNIIVTSDHGMTEVNHQRMIVLDKLLDGNIMYTSPGSSVRTVWALWPRSGVTAQDLYNKLIDKHKMMRVYLRENVPQNLHYKSSWRLAPVLLFAAPGWLIAETDKDVTSYKRSGEHGYAPEWPEMSPFLLATGPGFQQHSGDRTIPLIHMVDIYPLMCYLLDLNEPAPTNGSLDRVYGLLQPRGVIFGSFGDRLSVVFVCLLVVIIAVSFTAFVLFGCRCLRADSVRLLRRRRLRKLQRKPSRQHPSGVYLQHQHHSSVQSTDNSLSMHSLSRSAQHLLLHDDAEEASSENEDEEVDLFVGTSLQDPHVKRKQGEQDDMAWINMLHGSKPSCS